MLANLPYIIGFSCLALLFVVIILCFIIGTFPCLARRKRRSRKCFRKPSVLATDDLEMGTITSTRIVSEAVEEDRPLFREPRRVQSQPSGHCFIRIADEQDEKNPKNISSTGTQTDNTDENPDDINDENQMKVMIDVILDILQQKDSCTISTQTDHQITIEKIEYPASANTTVGENTIKIVDPEGPGSSESGLCFDDNFSDIEYPASAITSVGENMIKIVHPESPDSSQSNLCFEDNFCDMTVDSISSKYPAITKTSVGAMRNHNPASATTYAGNTKAGNTKKCHIKAKEPLEDMLKKVKIADPVMINVDQVITISEPKKIIKTAKPNKQRRRGYIDSNGRQMFV